MACDAFTFELDQPTYDRLYAQATNAKVIFTANIVTLHGMTFDWKYADGTLTVQCLNKPFYVSCEMIASKMRELVEQARSTS